MEQHQPSRGQHDFFSVHSMCDVRLGTSGTLDLAM